MGKRKNTPTKLTTTVPASTAPVDDAQQQPPLSSPTFSTGDPGTETETEEDDSFMDADGPSTATNSDNEQAEEEEKESLPHSHETDPNRESPSTPTRSRSPSSALSNRLSTASIDSPTAAESNDLLSPLSSTTTTIPSAASPSTYEKPKRPFSLSSEPDTPTFPTPSTPSPKKKPSASSSSFSPSGTVPISPSLTQQVWRNSMGLPPSPVTNPSSNGKLVDVNLSEPTLSNPSRISTTLDYTPGEASTSSSTANSPTTTTHFKSEAIEAAFARVREQSENAPPTVGEDGEEEVVDWDFWGRVMSDYEEVARTQPRELSKAIQRGIPQSLRGMTWQLMAAAKDPTLEMVYQELLAQTSSHEKSISRDLSRTFPKHEYFMDEAGVGQENLFNVVKAYSLYDEEVGYTQGLQFIVGPLLLNMPDEETFCVLVRLMKSYDLRSHYTPNMPGLQLRLFQFDRLVEELLPGVFLHMLRQGVKSSMYASQWFLTLFGYRFPLELVSAVFDLVFAEGVEAIFRFAIALIKRNEDVLLKLEFEDLIEFLKNGLFEVYAPTREEKEKNPDALYRVRDFVREALQVRITPMMLDQFGEEWSTLLAAQTAHTAELDALRKANLQLSLQVRQLESSLSQINLEHCELVKQVVRARLEREELEDELVKYKIAFANAEFKAASDRASMSPSSLRRQSELSISSVTSSDSSSGNNHNSSITSMTERGNSYSSQMSGRSGSVGY
ncbi:uncharacterized protein JCM6883_006648 [Sporobolomyces salmoneus]|uniref:uncharacterized protein n=1 Tax=Sporobolomyces salmoneus TaxID=183962 RepID=UPI003179B5C3